MRRVPAADEKPLHWVGSAKRDFLSFPSSVKDDMATLGIAQFGGTAPTAKPWTGLGPACSRSVSPTTETRIERFTGSIREGGVVLHAFQKKSPSGIPTAKRDVDSSDKG